MTTLRGTKRRLDLESDSPEPAETLTTDSSYIIAEEGTLPLVSSSIHEDDDMTEVSSPARPGRARKWTKQVKRLNEGPNCGIPFHRFCQCETPHGHCPHIADVCADAATFAKARTVFRRTSQPAAGRSQRELRAQLRAQRLQRKAAGSEGDSDDGEEADANELEAAASLVDLMAHEALPETGNQPLSQAQ